MINNERITATQLIVLIVINRFLFGFSFMPTVTISPANQDAWIAEIISAVLILILSLPMLFLANKFKDLSFAQYFEMIMGKPIGKVLHFLYVLYLLFIVLLSVVLLSDFLLSSIYPETPLYVIVAFMLIPCIYATYKGLECLGRTSVIIGTFIIFSVVVYGGLNFENMSLNPFFPIFHDSKMSLLSYGAFVNASRFCDFFLFFTFIPYVKKTKNVSINKIFIILVCSFTLLNLLITFMTQASLGSELAKTLRYPYYISIQQISLFGIIERIEFLNIIGWIVIFFYKISSTILCASMILKQMFGTKSYFQYIIPTNLIIALTVLMTGISYFPILNMIFTDYAFIAISIANYAIPLLVFGVFLCRQSTLKKAIGPLSN